MQGAFNEAQHKIEFGSYHVFSNMVDSPTSLILVPCDSLTPKTYIQTTKLYFYDIQKPSYEHVIFGEVADV